MAQAAARPKTDIQRNADRRHEQGQSDAAQASGSVSDSQ